jgi:hypothetical protein
MGEVVFSTILGKEGTYCLEIKLMISILSFSIHIVQNYPK